MNPIDDAARSGDFARALDLAVAAWRVTRDPVRADLVDVLAANVPATRIDERQYHKSWLALAAADRPADLDALLAGLRKTLPNPRRPFTDPPEVPAGWAERLTALSARRDDPRIASAMLDVFRQTPWKGYSKEIRRAYEAAAELVARAADVRSIPVIEALAQTASDQRTGPLSWLVRELLMPIVPDLRARPVAPPDAEIAALVDRYRPAVPVAASRVPELYAMVYASPGDDGPRHVLADVLLELGDPRGEFIALQLSEPNTLQKAERIASLLRAHRATWLGDLDPVLKSVVFERGFVAEAALENNAKAMPAVWERAARDERLATVERLYKGNGNEKHYTDFVFSPAMRNLKTIEVLSNKMIERILFAKTPWPFEHLILAKEPNPKQSLNFAVTKQLPAWTKLTVATRLQEIEALLVAVEPLITGHALAEVRLESAGDRLLPAWFTLVDRLAPTVLADAYVRVYRADGKLVVDHTLTQITTMYPDILARHVKHVAPKYDRLIVRGRPTPEVQAELAELSVEYV